MFEGQHRKKLFKGEILMIRATEVDKTMIRISETIEQADEYINEFFDLETWEEKVKFLEENFNIEAFDKPDKMTYWAALNTIIQL